MNSEKPVKGGRGQSKAKAKSVSRSQKAGLQFPVGRVARFLKTGRYAQRVGSGSPVYLSAVLEYLAAEVHELLLFFSSIALFYLEKLFFFFFFFLMLFAYLVGIGACWKRGKGQQEDSYHTEAHTTCGEER